MVGLQGFVLPEFRDTGQVAGPTVKVHMDLAGLVPRLCDFRLRAGALDGSMR